MDETPFAEFINSGKRELPADMRSSAKAMHTLYVAYREAGFTEDQSMSIVLSMLRTMMLQNPRGQ